MPGICEYMVSFIHVRHLGWRSHLQQCCIIVNDMRHTVAVSLQKPFCVCLWLPAAAVMSRVPSSLLPGECVWGESCPWLSWTQMCWTACTHWAVSGTESSSRVICNVKSKSLFQPCAHSMTLLPYERSTAMVWYVLKMHYYERCQSSFSSFTHMEEPVNTPDDLTVHWATTWRIKKAKIFKASNTSHTVNNN